MLFMKDNVNYFALFLLHKLPSALILDIDPCCVP